LRLSLSGALQVITLLPGIAFALIVAFLAIAVALDAGLVGSPFRLRLRSFVRVVLRTFIVVGTWFAFGGIELHLLQSVVVVVLIRNVAFGLPVSSIIVSVTASLFQLQLKDPIVDLDSQLREIL
jgi:hypothetical protein